MESSKAGLMKMYSIDIQEFDDFTGRYEQHDVVTITLGELIESGVFDWSNEMLDWSSAAYDDNQYSRVCAYFNERFYYREISMLPFKQWANYLHRKLVYELMPKYKPLYERISEGINPFQVSDEYYKERAIDSSYPETLLSANADYITDGRDIEHEKQVEARIPEMVVEYAESFKMTDELMLDELEVMFVSMYTVNVNGW